MHDSGLERAHTPDIADEVVWMDAASGTPNPAFAAVADCCRL